MKKDYYFLKIMIHRDGKEEVSLRKIERGEERVDDGKHYIRDGNGEPYKFYDKEEAISWLNKHVKYNLIDPEYRRPNQDKFLNQFGLEETKRTSTLKVVQEA